MLPGQLRNRDRRRQRWSAGARRDGRDAGRWGLGTGWSHGRGQRPVAAADPVGRDRRRAQDDDRGEAGTEHRPATVMPVPGEHRAVHVGGRSALADPLGKHLAQDLVGRLHSCTSRRSDARTLPSNTCCSLRSPRDVVLFTVPTVQPSVSAVSASDRSSQNLSTSTARVRGGSSSTARHTASRAAERRGGLGLGQVLPEPEHQHGPGPRRQRQHCPPHGVPLGQRARLVRPGPVGNGTDELAAGVAVPPGPPLVDHDPPHVRLRAAGGGHPPPVPVRLDQGRLQQVLGQ